MLTMVTSIITLIQGAMVTISILVPLVEVEESKILELRRLLLLLLLLDPEWLVLSVGHSAKLLVVVEGELLELGSMTSSLL